MIDIKLLRENPQIVEKAARDKGVNVDINKILELDKKDRELITLANELAQKINKTRTVPLAIKELKEKKSENFSMDVVQLAIKLEEDRRKKNKEEKEIREDLEKLLYQIPNIPKDDVPVGKDESGNKEIKKWGKVTKFPFTPKDHLELGEDLNIIDVKTASKVSGSRFAYLKNEAVLLEFALAQLAFDTLTKERFTPIIPPVLINQEITEKLGYWHGGGNEEYYLVGEPSEKKYFYLIGTAEHAIVPMHMDEVLNKKELPKRYVGFSTSFRREAGSYGKDTKGIFRVHQFDKVEMVSFTTEEESDREHDYLLSLEEKLFQALEIPYRVVKMCTGDLGFPAARKYDLESWVPSEGKYREVTSVSTTTDFQSRRLNIKYQDGNGKKYVHILNGTAFAIGRTIIAILENYQQKDGSILIPKILHKYLPFTKISTK